MLSLNQSFDDTRNIKVLVVPIGNNSLFENHFQVVSRLRDVPFYELNRPVSKNNANPAFKYFNWNNGNLLFDYLRYDRVPRGPGDLDNFQSSKRVLMIMGIINYPELGTSLNRIDEEMDYFSKRHPSILLRRIFVFNYSFDSIPTSLPTNSKCATPPPASAVVLKPLSDDANSLVIFPPEGICEGGTSMVDVHLNEVMSHAAVRIIGLLERQMEFCDDCRSKNILPVHLVQGTLYDELEDFSGTTKDSITSRSSSIVSAVNTIRGAAVSGGGAVGGSTKPGNNSTNLQYKKKPNGRIRKWMGDLSLQVCSPIDAIENYIPAIADCRALGDGLWLAGALEGYTTAIMLLLQQGGNINIEDIIGKDLKTITIAPGANNSADLDPEGGAPVYSLQTMSAVEKAYRLAEERANEAISIYAKNIVFCTMEVECTLRLARMYENCSVELPNKEQMVVDYVMRAVAVPGLNTQQSIECIIEGALMFRRLGLQRKYGFFLYIAALLCAENDNFAMAHALMHNACNEFGIHTGTEHFSPMDMTQNTADHPGLPSLCDEDGVRVVHPDQSWSSMRTMLLSNSVLMAKEHGDVVSAARFLSALMRLISELELRHNQTRANWALANQKYFGISTNNNSNNTNNSNGVTSSSKSSNTVNNTMLNSPLTEDTLKRLQQNSNDEPPHSDYKHKPSITTNNTSSIYNSSGYNNEQNDYSLQSKRQLFPLTNSNTVATGGRQNSLDGSVAGTVNGTPFRSPIGTRQPESVNKRTSVDDIAVDLAQNFADTFKRSFAVPKLPATLVNLVQKDSTDNGNTSYRPHSPSKVSLNGNGLIEKRPNELIGDRIKRHLHNDSEMFKRHFLSAVNNSDFTHGDFNSNSGNNNGSLGTDSSYVVDIMTSLSTLLLTQYIPLDQQYEIMHLFGTLNKALDTVHVVTLPVCLITLRPINLADPHKPYVLDCHAITNAKKGLELLQENYKRELQNDSLDYSDNVEVHSHDSHATNGQSQESSSGGANWDVVKAAAAAGGVSSANVTSKASSTLFYDPFAAARAKKVVKALDSVLWCSQQICTVVAVFSNSLSVPIQITNIVPVLEVIDSNTGLTIHSIDSGDSDGTHNKTDETSPDNQHNGKYFRTYPKPATIPANTTHFEVELHLKPLCESVSLRFTGVRVFMYNASYVVPVDDAGSAVKEKCAEICTVEGYPYKAVETKGKNNKSSTANTNTKNTLAGAVKDDSTMKSRGVATNLVKIACTKSSDYSLLASWSDTNQPVPDSVVPSTLTTVSKKGFGGNGSSVANRLSLKAPVDIKNTVALRNTIATTGAVDNEQPQPLKLSLYPGETRCESVQIAQLLGNNLQDLSTTDTRNLVSDFSVTLTQYPLNLAVNSGSNSTELKKQTVSSTLLDFHGPLNCAVSLADVASTVVQNNRNINKSAAACSVIFSNAVTNSISHNNYTNLETLLQLAFAYCAEPTVVELEFELVTSGKGSNGGSSSGVEQNLSAIGELNKYFNLVQHNEISADAEISNSSTKNAVTIGGNDSLITLLATTANSDVFTLYSRKIKLIVHLMPSTGLLCNSLRLTGAAVGGSAHETSRLNVTLSEMVVAHSNISNAISNNSGKNGSSNRNSMRIDGLAVGGSKLNVKVLSDRNHVVLQFTNASSLPVYLSNSKDTLTAAISKHIQLSDIRNTISCEEYKQTIAESNLFTVAVDRILEYNELVSGDSAVLVAIWQPNSIHNIIVNIPYATFECEENGSDAAEKVKGVLFWGVYDTTRTLGRRISDIKTTIQDSIRYGTVCSETASSTVTIANSKSSTNVSNSNELILSAQSNTICDLFKHRPPVSIEATITYTETGTENTIDNRMESTPNKFSRVPLHKFIDITARVNLVANRIYKQYAQHATTAVTLKFELAIVIVASEDPITSQLQPDTPGNTATGGILSQDSVTNSFDFSNNVTFLAQQPQNNYILTGQPYSRHELHQMKEIKHKLRVCFLNSGSYAVYTLLKFGGSEWWTPAQPIRVYVC